MTSTHYVVLAYVIAIAALWGYALNLWVQSRRLMKSQRSSRSREGAKG